MQEKYVFSMNFSFSTEKGFEEFRIETIFKCVEYMMIMVEYRLKLSIF